MRGACRPKKRFTIIKQEVLDPVGIELFVESRSSTLFPKIPEVSPWLFADLATANRGID
jgi:hypothetical protein